MIRMPSISLVSEMWFALHVAVASSLKARELKTIQSEVNYEITIYGRARRYLHCAREHWAVECLSLAKMLSCLNAFEISDIRQGETDGQPVVRM
jgi:hypothetical protein